MDMKKMSEPDKKQLESDEHLRIADENEILNQELEKINNLELSHIESYLKADPRKIVPNATTTNQ